MSFKSYYSGLNPEEKKEFAKKMGICLKFLSQLATGHRKAGVKVMAKIEQATNGALTRADIRPDIYGGA